MQELAAQPAACKAWTSGGFRLELSPNELRVTRLPNSTRMCLYWAAVIVYGIWCLWSGLSSLLIFAILLAAGAFGNIFTRSTNLRCTRDQLILLKVMRGRPDAEFSYKRSLVRCVRFGADSSSVLGSEGRLSFDVEEQRQEALRGLRSVEAQKILDEMQRLGFDVERDPGLPMMVEMEFESRSSRYRKWLA